MVSKVNTPFILPTSNTTTPKQTENNLFIGDWTDEDTERMCNPRKLKNESKLKDTERKRL